jgi:hypothetical protein
VQFFTEYLLRTLSLTARMSKDLCDEPVIFFQMDFLMANAALDLLRDHLTIGNNGKRLFTMGHEEWVRYATKFGVRAKRGVTWR